METGIGPVFAFEDFRVKWTFIGLELGFEENQEESVAGDGVGKGDEEGGQEFAAHGIR